MSKIQDSWFTVRRVASGWYALAEFHHFERVVSYLTVGRNQAALFDTGMGYADIRQAVRKLTGLPVAVFLTHSHWDHRGQAADFGNAAVTVHASEAVKLAMPVRSTDIPGLSDPEAFGAGYRPRKYTISAVHAAGIRRVADGQLITAADREVVVVHTPGHTPGSVCYFSRRENILVTGDTVYPGPLYAHLPESDPRAFSASLARLSAVTDASTLVLPGHNAVSAGHGLIKDAAALAASASEGGGGCLADDGYRKFQGSGRLSFIIADDSAAPEVLV